MKRTIVLAYSGGLDTSVIIPWLREHYDCAVRAVSVDVGQESDWDAVKQRALQIGAESCIVVDAKKEYVEQYVWPTLKAGAKYEGQYLLGTSTARPLIAKILVQEAHKCGADAIAHGATGKGNDQVRFDLGIRAFDPFVEIIAPWRTWDIKSREEEIAYLEKHGISLPAKKDDAYSRDDNLWQMSHEGLDLENPANEPKYEAMLKLCVTPENAPDQAEYVELEFEHGIPVKLGGETVDGVTMIHRLNKIGGRHGVGVIDLVENRVVGMKSRGVYETPGGSILYAAHELLEHLCLDRQMFAFKSIVADKFAELTYGGLWFTPLREALEAFVDQTQDRVTGKVRMKLFKGSIRPAGASSPYSLYNASIASFATGELYNHADSKGFIQLYGLPVIVRSLMDHGANKTTVTGTGTDPKSAGTAG
jgi:argininosuccinate synthase